MFRLLATRRFECPKWPRMMRPTWPDRQQHPGFVDTAMRDRRLDVIIRTNIAIGIQRPSDMCPTDSIKGLCQSQRIPRPCGWGLRRHCGFGPNIRRGQSLTSGYGDRGMELRGEVCLSVTFGKSCKLPLNETDKTSWRWNGPRTVGPWAEVWHCFSRRHS